MSFKYAMLALGAAAAFACGPLGPPGATSKKSVTSHVSVIPERCVQLVNGGVSYQGEYGREKEYIFCKNPQGEYSLFYRMTSADEGWNEIIYRKERDAENFDPNKDSPKPPSR